MNLSLRIARRYLFAKKSTNAINIITGVAVFGISVGTAALILVLSVFNGFEDLITGMYSNFNPDIKVTPFQGKTFEIDSLKLDSLKQLNSVAFVSQTLEEVAFFEYKKDNQDFGTLKGVDENFTMVTNLDSTVREGVYMFRDGPKQLAVLGLGMRNKLGINVDDLFSPISVYMPKRQQAKGLRVGLSDQQFKKRFVYPAGTFVIQQEFDNQYVLSSLEFARDLMDYDKEVSALEIKLNPAVVEQVAVEEIKAVMGYNFVVKTRYQQEEAFLRLMQMEKWLSFAIVSLMLLLVAFNIIGALWMVVLEKKKDIAILKSMGALDTTVRNIFLNEGVLLSILGVFIGFILALLIFLVQKYYGLIGIPGDFIIDSYPISLRIFDFVVVALTVTMIGLLASIPPALRSIRISALIKAE